MTDITELAQRARINAECGEHLSPAETMELVEALESEKRICATWRKTAEANSEKLEKSEKTSEARREAIGRAHNMFVRERDRANAAEEALEKAQAQSSKWLEAYHKAVSIGARYEERIAELESRTVTVKLPFTPEPSAFAPWVAKAFYQFHKDTVKSCVAVFSDACATAGIKWEVE